MADLVATSNQLYIHEMSDPRLQVWAERRGFTLDELARIQPGYPVDRDGDGWTYDRFSPGGDLDCDDRKATVNPSVDENCGDGIDNNCDGDIDEPTCTGLDGGLSAGGYAGGGFIGIAVATIVVLACREHA